MSNPFDEHTRILSIFQKYNRLNLLIPDDIAHMWNAVMKSKSCGLAAIGEHYRRLAVKGRIKVEFEKLNCPKLVG